MNCLPNRRRLAFTLVELLVVIAIIGILIGMLLPAVQSVREAARRSACQNNLKQIGLALQNYHSVIEEFPGYVKGPHDRGWGWGTVILPFMEEEGLEDILDINTYNFAQTRDGIAGAIPKEKLTSVIAGYQCPSTEAPNTVFVGTNEYAVSSYAASRGFGHAGYFSDILSNNGGLGAHPRSMSAFIDGTSNTMMVGEASARYGGFSPAGNGRGIASWAGNISTNWWDYQSTLSRAGSYPLNHIYHWGFTTAHPLIGNFVFADGSVHPIAETINFDNGSIGGTWYNSKHKQYYDNAEDFGTWQRLIVRDDGTHVSW